MVLTLIFEAARCLRTPLLNLRVTPRAHSLLPGAVRMHAGHLCTTGSVVRWQLLQMNELKHGLLDGNSQAGLKLPCYISVQLVSFLCYWHPRFSDVRASQARLSRQISCQIIRCITCAFKGIGRLGQLRRCRKTTKQQPRLQSSQPIFEHTPIFNHPTVIRHDSHIASLSLQA